MKFYEANVVDIVRCSQRDNVAVNELEEYLHSVVKLFASRNYHGFKKDIPIFANLWYYLITSGSNLQTLGEEYTGTLRLDQRNKVPSKLVQLLWLTLYVGGEPLLDRLIKKLKLKIATSESLTENAKLFFNKSLDFTSQQKQILRQIHHSIFYIKGKYYNISNRLTGIKYVLVRQWLQDDYFTQGFRWLGQLSLLYVLFNFFQKLWDDRNSTHYSSTENNQSLSNKLCALCCEPRKSSCATPCGHIFCWNCIFDSLEYQKSCPLCREYVTANRIIFLQNY